MVLIVLICIFLSTSKAVFLKMCINHLYFFSLNNLFIFSFLFC